MPSPTLLQSQLLCSCEHHLGDLNELLPKLDNSFKFRGDVRLLTESQSVTANAVADFSYGSLKEILAQEIVWGLKYGK
ncbi:hypothetical protein Dimus_031772, partial [Dionaea muscipula]